MEAFYPIAFAGDEFAGAAGVAAAVLLVGTSFALRWQRNRQRFELVRIALENGASAFPPGPAYWVASLREGLTILTLGIGLLISGSGAFYMGDRVPMPSHPNIATTSAAMAPAEPAPSSGPDLSDGGAPPGHFPPDHGGRPFHGPGDFRELPPREMNPHDGPPGSGRSGPGADAPGREGRPRDERDGPPRDDHEGMRQDGHHAPPSRQPQSPELEAWHRAQDMKSIGLAALGCGLILALLGAVRVAYAQVERLAAGSSDSITSA